MKKIIVLIYVVAAVLALSSCRRTLDVVAEYDVNSNKDKAFLKVIHASPNFRKVWNTRDSFNILVNGTKINSSIITYNSLFPFSVNSTTNSIIATYASVPAGAASIKLTNPGATSVDSFGIVTLDKVLAAGSYYTLLITDSLKNGRDSSKIFINDRTPIPALSGNYNLRFIYAAANATDTIDVFSFARNANIFAGVRSGMITDFAAFGYNIAVPDSLFIRKRVGTGAVPGPILAKLPLNGANTGTSSLDGRTLTVYYKGDVSVATGTKAPSASVYLNF